MRLVKSFINDYISINDIDFKEIADRMVLAGNEYESIGKISDASNLVVGYVKESIKHPESKKLSINQIDLGDGELKQILCGAPNIQAGQKVIVAKVGAVLPDGTEIKKANLAGMESNGMVCSLSELGIESKFLSEEDKEGIHVLDESAEVGSDAIKYLGYDDEVIDFELTSNRADLLSVIGMAYEVGALFDKKVKLPEIEVSELKENVNDSFSLQVKTDNCPLYLAKLVKNVVIKESPNFIKARLMASGIRPINNVVDISNYVMLEYGQPLHFFDADKLGNKIIVRMAKDGEKIVTLDNQERILKEDDIVIANGNESVALAGVMGGLSTEITDNTTNILIESAIFNPYNIRRTSNAILRSESSNRFEKGIDPNGTLNALKRACYLLSIYADGEVASGVLEHDIIDKKNKKITIDLEKINTVLGMDLKLKDVEKVLKSLVFDYNLFNNTFDITVPTRRLDVNIKEDIIEEIGRIHGYNNLVGSLPVTTIKRGSYSAKSKLIKQIRTRLQSLGLNQVITYSLISENELNRFVDEKFEPVILANPMSEDKKIMRNSLITSLISVWKYNTSRNIKNINIFEIGSVYSKKEDSYIEETKLSGLMYGEYITNKWQNNNLKVDFYLIKGIIENILQYLGLNNRYQFSLNNLLKDMHPGRSCNILVDNEIVGFMGQVHPNVNKKPIYIFELSIDKLLSKSVRLIKFKELNKFPSVNKDVAFIIKKEINSDVITNIIKKTAGRLLTDIDIFDVYVGENVGTDEKSIAYSLTFQDNNKTLNDEEVTELFNKIITNVEEKANARLRSN